MAESINAMDTEGSVTFVFPRIVIDAMEAISPNLTRRMHHLLERNTDGALSPIELEELEALVNVVTVANLVSALGKMPNH